MAPAAERRMLQIAVGIASLVPVSAGLTGGMDSAAMLAGVDDPLPIDLDSHYRYLSGLLLGIGVGFAACVPAIERRGALFRALGLIVVLGGLARLLSLFEHGLPGPGDRFGLAMALVAVPLLILWQARVARRTAR